jgi:hypothetical protein
MVKACELAGKFKSEAINALLALPATTAGRLMSTTDEQLLNFHSRDDLFVYDPAKDLIIPVEMRRISDVVTSARTPRSLRSPRRWAAAYTRPTGGTSSRWQATCCSSSRG